MSAEVQTDSSGQLVFRSSDSLNFRIKAFLNCDAQYAMVASVQSPETLAVAVTLIGNSRAKCMCKKEVTLGFKSTDATMEKIEFVDFNGWIYFLK